jgi:hypothetical protein
VISFECDDCRTKLRVDVKHAGKRVKCSQCSSIVNIPNKPSARLVFCICAGCKANFNSSDSDRAKTIECPKCQKPVAVPGKDQITSDNTTVRFTCGKCSKAYCVPAKYAGKKFPCVKCKTACSISKLPEPEEEAGPIDTNSFDWDNVDDRSAGPSVPKTDKKEESQEQTDPTDDSFHDPLAFNANEHLNKKQDVSEKASTKKLLIIGGCVAGFYIMILLGFLLVMAQTPPDKSRDAMFFSSHLVHLANQGTLGMPLDISKTMNMDTNFVEVMDHIENGLPEKDLQVIGALAIGKIIKKEPTIEYTTDAFGALGYIVKCKIKSGFGIEREAFVAIVESRDSFRYIQIIVNDTSGNQLASTGDKTIDELKEELDAIAWRYSWLSTSGLAYLFLVTTSVWLVNVISYWRVLEMAGQPGWAVLIPVYQFVALAKAGDKNALIGVALALTWFIPIIGLALLLYITIGVAKTYNRGIPFGVGMGLLPAIFFPVLAFSENTFN